MISNKLGYLIVKVIRADITHNTEWFSSMDPFASIAYKMKEYDTKVHKKGGKHPEWNESLVIEVDSILDDLTIRCFDKDFMVNDLIGEGSLKIYELVQNDNIEMKVILYYDASVKKKGQGNIGANSSAI